METEWYDKAWQYRKMITINSKMVSGTAPLLGFPLLFESTDIHLSKHAQNSGDDFLFTSTDGRTKLSHEIQFWDSSNGRVVAYIKIPVLSATKDTIIYLYYGNPDCVNQENPNAVWSNYLYRKNFRGDPLAPLDTKDNEVTDETGTPLISKFLMAQKGILSGLFGLKWFEQHNDRTTRHPAYKRWKLCEALLSRNGRFKFPQDEPLLPELAKVMIENVALVQCTKGELDSFKLGSIANYGDQAVQKRLRSEIKFPSKYFDVLTELQFAAWHISRKHQVKAYEKAGADHEILISGWDLSVISDCKRIARDTSASRIRKVIAKANQQIKQHPSSCYGIVVIDLSEKVPVCENITDCFPPELEVFRNEAVDALKFYYSSISAALLIWNEIHIIGPKGGGNLIMVVLRTRSKIVHHQKPKKAIPPSFDLNDIKVANHISFNIRLNR